MSALTRRSPASSCVSGRVFSLKPERSAALAWWWFALHVLVVASIVASDLGAAPKWVCVAAAIAHGLWRLPARPTTVLRAGDGIWAMPERGLSRLRLDSGTAVGPYWILLRFAARERSVSVLLLRDQLDRDTWRALQAELRRTIPADTI